MKSSHIMAVFRAEYNTTTYKFSNIRKWVPVGFFAGIFMFSLLLRIIYDFLRGDVDIGVPPVGTFFSIIAIFSYFTLFAPLLSPLGRVVYDGAARARREVALNSPVSSKDLLYGNLLSNLAFFLPFFAFIGTIMLAPFMGNGIFSPLATSFILFLILSLLILIGLVAGTLVSPLIYNFIGKQKGSASRAVVTLMVSGMMILSMPLLRFLLENVDTGNLGWTLYLPFILATSLIIYTLYGVTIGLSPLLSTAILILYVVIVALLGYFAADTLYSLEDTDMREVSSEPDLLVNRLISLVTRPIPRKYRTITRSTLKASLRDIEHISRLTIGISITVFMIFALSSRGLFRNTTNFPVEVELAVIIFALILSSASVIFIESASFTVQHRDMFALIKSAPDGPKKFVIAKAIQMTYLLLPIFISLILSLNAIDLVPSGFVLPLLGFIILSNISLICISLGIYLINPSDNQEDITNFINLLVFYIFAFIQATVPVIITLSGFSLSFFHILGGIAGTIFLAFLSLWVAIYSLDQMDLETLDSPFTRAVKQGFTALVLTFFGWIFLPIFALPYFISSQNVFGLLMLTYLFNLILPIIYWYFKKNFNLLDLDGSSFVLSVKALAVMLSTALLIIAAGTLIASPVAINPIFSVNFTTIQLIILVIALVLTEELFFRGFILDYSRQNMKNAWAIIVSSVFFALLHIGSPLSLINALVQGVILGYLRVRTRSVLYPILSHLSYNFLLLGVLLIF